MAARSRGSRSGPRRIASAALVAAALLSPSCRTDTGPEADRATTAPAAPGPGTTAADVAVRTITIAVDDPVLGRLTFPALAAGDPALAARGRLVLFLHGFPETGASYAEVLPGVAAAGYYAVAPDQRGYAPGARPADVDAYNILRLVDDVTGMAGALGADRFHLVGHDWGGGVAWAVAALRPERLASLTALSTPHPDALSDTLADPDGEQARHFGYMATFRAPGSEDRMLADGPEGFVTTFTTGGIPRPKAQRYAEVLGTAPALGAALNWYRANPMPPAARVGAVHVPTTYVFGADDIAFTRESAEATRRYVDAPYRFDAVDGLSHWIPEVAPDRVVAAVVDRARSVP
jgi:pimeloyl-ACP methyl ester carboxylesterase